ncbi:MAG: hypothetical protein AAB368_04175 [bacterium]
MKTRRTTLILDEDLYRQVKRLAVDRDTRLKDVVREALVTYLAGGAAEPKPAAPRHRTWRLDIQGSLSRRELYRDYMKGPTYRRGD